MVVANTTKSLTLTIINLNELTLVDLIDLLSKRIFLIECRRITVIGNLGNDGILEIFISLKIRIILIELNEGTVGKVIDIVLVPLIDTSISQSKLLDILLIICPVLLVY